jgi:large subunit ribosomal protein L18
MKPNELKILRRTRRKRVIRKRVYGTAERPRLTVFRSLKNIYAQIIDDDAGVTICAASTRDRDLRDDVKDGGNVAAAKLVGTALAERARGKNVEAVCFDRNGFRYHGRLKALADAAREAGLKL